MRSGILRTYVATLRLRRDAPFPSQLKSRATRFLMGHISGKARSGAGSLMVNFSEYAPIREAPNPCDSVG